MSTHASEMTARLTERTIVALQPLDTNHPTCAAGHTPENHLKMCHDCWTMNHHLKEQEWHGQQKCPMYLALVADSLMPNNPDDLDDITFHQMQADHKRNYEGCALMVCGLERYTKDLTADWRNFGKQTKLAMDDHERKLAHSLNEPRHIRRGRWGTISKEVFFDNQILYRVKDVGMGLDGRPFAKIKMANSDMVLYVDLGDVLSTLSKNAKRKSVRYGKKTDSYSLAVSRACNKAVDHYLSH